MGGDHPPGFQSSLTKPPQQNPITTTNTTITTTNFTITTTTITTTTSSTATTTNPGGPDNNGHNKAGSYFRHFWLRTGQRLFPHIRQRGFVLRILFWPKKTKCLLHLSHQVGLQEGKTQFRAVLQASTSRHPILDSRAQLSKLCSRFTKASQHHRSSDMPYLLDLVTCPLASHSLLPFSLSALVP